MQSATKNKLLMGLLVLLLLANAATITSFWLGRKHPRELRGAPSDFLIKELNFDKPQQQQFLQLVKEHQQAAEAIRRKIKEAKDSFFDLLMLPVVSDSMKNAVAYGASNYTAQLDILTFNHFQKVRALCNADQQKKFDSIIHQVTNMMAMPRPGPGGPDGQGRPPGPDGERPPPPGQ